MGIPEKGVGRHPSSPPCPPASPAPHPSRGGGALFLPARSRPPAGPLPLSCYSWHQEGNGFPSRSPASRGADDGGRGAQSTLDPLLPGAITRTPRGSGPGGGGGGGARGPRQGPSPTFGGGAWPGECQEEEERGRRRCAASRGPVKASAVRATMATDELATKLSRRLQMEGEGGGETPEQPGLNGAAAAAAGAPDEAAEALGSADCELSAKLLRRADLNQGIGEPQSPSRRVFNPYTEFKEFSRKQIKDMEKMFKQ